MKFKTSNSDFTVRIAEKKDINIVFGFVKELAAYEDLSHRVTATEETIYHAMFEKKLIEAMIGEYKGVPVGFFLYYYTFSTFAGKAGIYLEDVYIKPEMRRKGFGKAMFEVLAAVAKERGCNKLEWQCLNWNEPSIKFYTSLGAKPVDDWTVYNIQGDKMDALAQNIIQI